ncbi:MAG: transcription termination factor Rho, partial [Verrucomicrobiota bacterium]
PEAQEEAKQKHDSESGKDHSKRSSDQSPREKESNESGGKKAPKNKGKDEGGSGKQEGGDGPPRKSRKQRYLERKEKERAREAAALEAAPPVESEGIVEISNKGFGFLREKKRGFQQSPNDVFITPEVVRNFALRDGLMVKCISKQGVRGPQLVELLEINGREPKDYLNLPYFEELTAINPDKKLTLETEPTRQTTRVIDLMAPIGRGQRGLIVAPPRTGKTTLLHHIAEGIRENYDEEIHLMVLLVDERPEEVTDFERSFPDVEVFSSSNDSDAKDHTRMALLAIERAKRLVEAGEHVFILMDSITRLARAFNSQMRGGGKRGTASGGLLVGALEIPRRIFAAARNTREAGSLTIIATALIQTNSKADEAIFQEFKGTGNMELVLDRQIAQNYVYPAVDINRSGTRREELLLPPHMLEKIYVIRRGLSGYKPLDAMEWLLRCMERYPSNAQMLMDIKTTALS